VIQEEGKVQTAAAFNSVCLPFSVLGWGVELLWSGFLSMFSEKEVVKYDSCNPSLVSA